MNFVFRHIQQYLSELLQTMADHRNLKNVSYLTKDVHVWPDFHGNRSPLADPTLKGMVTTLNISYVSCKIFDYYLSLIECWIDIGLVFVC